MAKILHKTCLLALLIVLSLSDNLQVDPSTTEAAPELCDVELYLSLNQPRKWIVGPLVHLDLFNVLNQTNQTDPRAVLHRIGKYESSEIYKYLSLLDQSFNYEKVYRTFSTENIASFDYQNICTELCPVSSLFTGFRTPKMLVNTPKPAYLDNFLCSVPDNPLCRADFQFLDQKNDNLLNSFDVFVERNHLGLLVVYKDYLGQGMEYCYTFDEQTQKLVHVCEKYYQYFIQKNNYFASETQLKQVYDAIVMSDPESQTAMNYILTKMKFGEQLGEIYSDCRRHGPIVIDTDPAA